MKAPRWFVLTLVLAAVICFRPCSNAAQTNSLSWHKQQNSMDADINSWDLRQFLEHLAVATGWHIYLDPQACHEVSVKFHGLSVTEALHSSLGGLNFVLIPGTNSSSRLYVFRTSQKQATQFIAPPRKKAQPIQNELVVQLKPGAKTRIEDLARSLNAKIIGRMDSQHAYLLQFQDAAATQSALTQLASNPDVAGIDVNYQMDPPPALNASQSTDPDLQLKPVTNSGPCQLVVGLIDTPVQTLPGNLNSFLNPSINVVPSTSTSTNINHGTAMAQAILDGVSTGSSSAASATGSGSGAFGANGVSGILGTYPTAASTSVRIQPVDVYGSSESTTTFDVANGIVQAVNAGANIINLSLGGTGDSQTLHNTIIAVSQQGIPIYAAAGNDPVTTPTYPAAYPEVISVTATDPNGQLASYANRGSFIDMTAPGDAVVGYNGQSYMVEGTSTSTAYISGVAAGLADANHDCANQAESLLQKSPPANATILKPAQ